MSRGMQVTTGVDINYAQDDDFVLNTNVIGGLKVYKKLFFNYPEDFTSDASGQPNTVKVYSHGLPYVPAVLCFVSGNIGQGFNNEAVSNNTASADATNVYMYYGGGATPNAKFCLLIFGEKVSDS